MRDSHPKHFQLAPLAVALFCLSTALIALELVLMRYLSFVSYHHFAYLVISTGLLGFGISGSLLTLFGRRMRSHFSLTCTLLTAGFSVSVILCVWLAQILPVNFQYALYDRRQAALLILYHFTFLIPFLFGALVIGLSLSQYTESAPVLYGSNMCGSGAGAVVAISAMFFLPEINLFFLVSLLALAACAAFVVFSFFAATCSSAGGAGKRLWCSSSGLAGVCIAAMATMLLAAAWLFLPLDAEVDEHKMLHDVRQLEKQGHAEHVLTRHSPRGRIDVYSSPRLRSTPFVGFSAWIDNDGVMPPDQFALIRDGQLLSPVFRVRDAGQSAIMDHTIMSLPYRAMEAPGVLLLGEAGGLNVWLARRMGAVDITSVHGDPVVYDLLTGPLAEPAGEVFSRDDMTLRAISPRLFLERAERGRYDIIQLAAAEGMAAGYGGLMALSEDFLMTRQAFALCLRSLTDSGVLAVSRGIQTPPRDNIKILATAAAALEQKGVEEPGRHIIQMHNHLGVITLVSPSPFTGDRTARLAEAADYLRLDTDWAVCENLPPGNSRARLPGPPGSEYSYYHYAATEIFSGRSEALFREWVYNIRPSTDNSPYFHNFFCWRSLPVLREVYGRDWLRRAEFGYVVAVAGLAEVTVIGAILILLPLLRLRRKDGEGAEAGGASGGHIKLFTVLYFVALGLAFMMIEMIFIVRLAHLLGDPVLSAGGVLCAFLVFSGLGSATSGRLFADARSAVCVAVGGIIILGITLLFALGPLIRMGAGWGTAARMTAAVLMLAPLAYLMGMPFPNGLRMFGARSDRLVPWAWGINGFASVAAAPLGLLAGMEFGFTAVIIAGLILYAAAAAVAVRVSMISVPTIRP